MISLTTIILAAGKGTRMKSARVKVLHEVFDVPMVHRVLQALQPLNPKQNIVVVGHQESDVRAALAGFEVDFASQTEQLGTGHAVLSAEPFCRSHNGVVMILCGDTPLLSSESLEKMWRQHQKTGAVVTLMTTILADPTNYGRIIKIDGKIQAIVEEKDASSEQKKIGEVNAGIYCVDQQFLFSALKQVGTNNKQGEMYLTDIVAIAVRNGHLVDSFVNESTDDLLGVNSRIELAQAHQELLMRRNRELMLQGVTMLHPQSVTVENGVEIGMDTILHHGVELRGTTRIGKDCIIKNGTVIVNSLLGDGVVVAPGSYIENQQLAAGTVVPPHSCLIAS